MEVNPNELIYNYWADLVIGEIGGRIEWVNAYPHRTQPIIVLEILTTHGAAKYDVPNPTQAP